jgi:hypothetical protein
VHYDLPWNPNRLEQREGRVDRFGQPKREVRTVLLYGTNNEVDQVVLDALIRKATAIRKSLGIAVPVPVDPEQVMETVVDNVLLARVPRERQLELALSTPDVSRLHAAWDEAAEREKRERGFFAQRGIKPDEVAQEIEATDSVLGDPDTVRRFVADALQRFGGRLTPRGPSARRLGPRGEDGTFELIPGEMRGRLAPSLGSEFPVRVAFSTVRDSVPVLGRTHPAVAVLCEAVLSEAFGAGSDARFVAPARCVPMQFGCAPCSSCCGSVTAWKRRSPDRGPGQARNLPRRLCSSPSSDGTAVSTGSNRWIRPAERSSRPHGRSAMSARRRRRSRSSGRSNS